MSYWGLEIKKKLERMYVFSMFRMTLLIYTTSFFLSNWNFAVSK